MTPDSAAVRAQLRRILASREFASAERMSRFLSLAVNATLEGRADRLKEYTFGVEVFDRPAAFNPAADPIVRVEARRLRAKLGKYYENEGRHDELLIELPKGAYVPSFRARRASVAAGRAKRIAVVPFIELSAQGDGSFFSEGLTWEVIHSLTRIEGLSVVAWQASGDIAAIRGKLDVEAVLAGSVRRAAGRLRVVAQLIDAASGVYLWSETYDRGLEDTADVQQEISQAIAATLRMRFAGAAGAHGPARYHPEAYQLYLRGRGQWNRRSQAGLLEGLESFRQAAALAPDFALAYAGMADSYALLAEYGLDRPAEVVPHALAAARRALEIDPTLGEAHCSLALVLAMYEWKWTEAEAHFRRALDLNPGYPTAHHWMACDFLAMLGRVEEARREIRIARELDPLSSIIAEGSAFVSMLGRRYEEAAAGLAAIVAADPSYFKAHTALGRVLIQMGRYEEAIAELARGRQMAGDVPSILGAMGQAYGLAGDKDKARGMLAQLEAASRRRFVNSTCFALVHLGLEERERAIEWLERGVARAESSVAIMGVHPAYDALREEPRFTALLEKMGLRAGYLPERSS